MKNIKSYLILVIVNAVILSSCTYPASRPDDRNVRDISVKHPKCFLNRNDFRIAILPVINESDNQEAGGLLDKTATLHFEGRKKDYEFMYKTVKIVVPEEVITYTITQGITLQDLYKMPDQELGKKFGVDFILRNKVKHVLSWEVYGQTILIESASGATVWYCDWNTLYVGEESVGFDLLKGFFDHLLKPISEALTNKTRSAIEYGFIGVLHRMPVIGRPVKKVGKKLREDKKTHDVFIDF
ncbi:MAG: hypothetical protein AB1599_02040 [Planctomycetota bacterium]